MPGGGVEAIDVPPTYSSVCKNSRGNRRLSIEIGVLAYMAGKFELYHREKAEVTTPAFSLCLIVYIVK
jgi:hypothetical protein